MTLTKDKLATRLQTQIGMDKPEYKWQLKNDPSRQPKIDPLCHKI